jgi:hypothetical protein
MKVSDDPSFQNFIRTSLDSQRKEMELDVQKGYLIRNRVSIRIKGGLGAIN